jgi:hypothetical protein
MIYTKKVDCSLKDFETRDRSAEIVLERLREHDVACSYIESCIEGCTVNLTEEFIERFLIWNAEEILVDEHFMTVDYEYTAKADGGENKTWEVAVFLEEDGYWKADVDEYFAAFDSRNAESCAREFYDGYSMRDTFCTEYGCAGVKAAARRKVYVKELRLINDVTDDVEILDREEYGWNEYRKEHE